MQHWSRGAAVGAVMSVTGGTAQTWFHAAASVRLAGPTHLLTAAGRALGADGRRNRTSYGARGGQQARRLDVEPDLHPCPQGYGLVGACVRYW
jgi:hypothetical protein